MTSGPPAPGKGGAPDERQWTISTRTVDVGRDLSGMTVLQDQVHASGPKPPSPVGVVPLERALRAEEAARDFADALRDGASHVVEEGPNAGWRGEGGDIWYDDDLRCRPDCPICTVLKRHPGFLPTSQTGGDE